MKRKWITYVIAWPNFCLKNSENICNWYKQIEFFNKKEFCNEEEQKQKLIYQMTQMVFSLKNGSTNAYIHILTTFVLNQVPSSYMYFRRRNRREKSWQALSPVQSIHCCCCCCFVVVFVNMTLFSTMNSTNDNKTSN